MPRPIAMPAATTFPNGDGEDRMTSWRRNQLVSTMGVSPNAPPDEGPSEPFAALAGGFSAGWSPARAAGKTFMAGGIWLHEFQIVNGSTLQKRTCRDYQQKYTASDWVTMTTLKIGLFQEAGTLKYKISTGKGSSDYPIAIAGALRWAAIKCNVVLEATSGVHPTVTCDRSRQKPIVGYRYNLRGEDYDLCQAEFDKLTDEEKLSYDKIPPSVPGA